MVNLASTFAFWKKRGGQKPSESERIIPLPNLSSSVDVLASPPATFSEAVNRARDALKVLKLERQITGSAVTTIYESHSKGVISETERNRMLERYKVDLKRLEKEIEENQQIVQIHDLETEREELIEGFRTKLAELDAKLNALKSGSADQTLGKAADPATTENKQAAQNTGSNGGSGEQKLSESEKRLQQIREEILKAMDRLEQIETEG